MNESVVTIYADGGCRGNPGVGGWGAILSYGNATKELYGFSENTTNNQMELTAVIQALTLLTRPCKVMVFTDSKYVVEGCLAWRFGWKNRGWKTAKGEPVKNMELWKELDLLLGKHSVQFTWVKGHNGDPGNERADALANKAMDEQKGS